MNINCRNMRDIREVFFMRNATWKDEAIGALIDLGGVAHISDIFSKIVERGKIDMSTAETPERTLARVLQTHSYSTSYGIENIFYSVYGVEARKGIWGLVDHAIDNIGVSLIQDEECFSEGKVILRKHIIRERNSQLIKRAKEKFKEKHEGKLYCEICKTDFSQVYGDLGKDFIEAHHIKPVSEMQDGDETSINDIVMLCSNCHSMVHRRKSWLTREELKSILKNNNSI